MVSEPVNEQEECEDVGYAYLDLRELLLTGNDVIEKQINGRRMQSFKKRDENILDIYASSSVCFSPSVVSPDEEQEVVGKLKVSVEAAQALTGIYKEYHQIVKRNRRESPSSTEDEEEEVTKKKEELHVLDFEVDEDSDFY